MEEQTIEAGRGSGSSRPERAAWGGTLVLGLLWVALGAFCLVATGAASLAAVYYVGALMALGGLLSLGFGFRGAGAAPVVLGILSLVVGALMFVHPGTGLASLTLLLIGYFWIAGLFKVVTSLLDRYEGWGYDFAQGLSSIAIGAIAARSWPISAFWLLGVLVASELIARGVFMIAGAMSARHVMHALRSPA